MLEKLKKYTPRSAVNIEDKKNVLENAQNLYDGREMIVDAFKNKLFPLYSGNYYEEVREESSESKDEDEEPIEETKKNKLLG